MLLSASPGTSLEEAWLNLSPAGYSQPDFTYSEAAWLGGEGAGLMDMAPSTFLPEAPLGGTGETGSLAAYGTYTLYLNFTGGAVQSRNGDFWLGANSITMPAFSLGGFGWAGREAEAIGYIADFVREDYAAYNVQVTTARPASGEYTTMYIGGANSWFQPGSGVIGVATYDIGNTDPSNYGFAFTDELDIYYSRSYGSLFNFSEYIANLVSHEAAHTYGANHIDDVNELMNPYLPLTPRRSMFGRGPITNSTAIQDSQSLMGQNLGYAHGADDYGSTRAAAQAIQGGATVQGMLERRDDVDAFKFTPGASGVITVDITTAATGNLDSYLKLYQGDTLLAENNDASGLDAFLSLNGVAGQTYTVLISSNGGGSLGRYSLQLGAGPAQPEMALTDNLNAATDRLLNFPVTSVSASRTATFAIANNGYANLVISQMSASGIFQLSRTSLAHQAGDDIVILPGSAETVTVTFTPAQALGYTGTVSIVSNDPQHPTETLSLTGTGQAAEPDLTLSGAGLSGSSLNFGPIIRGESATESLTLRNSGYLPLTISAVNLSAAFNIVSGFGGTPLVLDPGETTNLVIGVTPAARGAISGLVTITSNDPDYPIATIALAGSVKGGVLAVAETAQTANDGAIDFGTVYRGETSTRTITLTNTGDADLRLRGLGVDPGFNLSLPLDLANAGDDLILVPGQARQVVVSYSPQAQETRMGTVVITTDNIEAPQGSVSLQAQGEVGALGIVELDGSANESFDAGAVELNAHNLVSVWQITNHGNIPLTIHLTLAQGDDFRINNPEVQTLSPGQAATVRLELTSAQARRVTDTLTVSANDVLGTHQSITVTADAYARLGNGRSYRFTSRSGGQVTVLFTGTGGARLTLGDNTGPDIEQIQLIPGSNGSLLVAAGSTPISLGGIAGIGSLRSLQAPRVNLVGAGINLDGTIGSVQLGDISHSSLNFNAGAATMLRCGQIDSSDLAINGTLRMLLADAISGGSFQAGAIGSINIKNDLAGNVSVTQANLDSLLLRQGSLSGDIDVAGGIGGIAIFQGNLLGSVTAGSDISRIILMRGEVQGSVHSGGVIRTFVSGGIVRSSVVARDGIDNLLVRGDVRESTISIGYDPASSAAAAAARVGINAQLGNLAVAGAFSGSTIAVGVQPDGAGSYLNAQAAGAGGRIGFARLGSIDPDNADQPFGIFARDTVGRVQIDKQVVFGNFQLGDFFVKTF